MRVDTVPAGRLVRERDRMRRTLRVTGGTYHWDHPDGAQRLLIDAEDPDTGRCVRLNPATEVDLIEETS